MEQILAITAIIILGGLIKGLNGFGYALVSTPLLGFLMPIEQAVALMIIPLLAANTELIFEIDRKELLNCIENFSGLITSLLIGATAGMLLLSWIPTRPLETAVGLTAVTFSVSKSRFLHEKTSKASEICFKSWEPAIGFLSGIVYGASNVAVTAVAYLKSRDLTQEKFTATLAAIILILSVYRIFLAQVTGLYGGNDRILFSLILGVPALIAVKIGTEISDHLPQKFIQQLSLLTIAVIGLRLLMP